MNRPAATTSTSDSATCTTTSTLPRPSRPSPTTPRPCSFSASFGCDARAPQRRRHAEQHGGRDRHGGGEAEHAPVERQRRETRCWSTSTAAGRAAGCPSARRRARAPRRAPDSSRLSASSCRAMRQPRRAERQPHAQLVAPRRRAREQQVRDVGAGDQQHQPDDDHDRGQRPAIALAQARAAGGRGAGARTPPSDSSSLSCGRQSCGIVASRICGCTPRNRRVARPRGSDPASGGP